MEIPREAIWKMVRMGDAFAPDMKTHEFYNQLNQRVYRHVNRHFDPVLKELGLLVEGAQPGSGD